KPSARLPRSRDKKSAPLSSRGLSPGPIGLSGRHPPAQFSTVDEAAMAMGPGNKCRDDSGACGKDRTSIGIGADFSPPVTLGLDPRVHASASLLPRKSKETHRC